MTSATEKLRRLLDERGVEYEAPHAGFTIVRTDNAVCKFYETLEEPERGVFAVVTTDWLAPAQAIAATLGATDARPTQAESSGTCHMVLREDIYGHVYQDIYECSECGEYVVRETYMDESEPPNYCPNCGRRVVGE